LPAIGRAAGVVFLALIAVLFLSRGQAAGARHPPHVYGALAGVVAAAEAWCLFQVVRALRRRIVFDGARREVSFPDADGSPRVIAFDAIRGVRVRPSGRGFQFRVELVTAADAVFELMTTGRVEIARELAGGLSARFGFAALVE
jgi:hypothetical protein